jgi:hypothetical protein
MDDRVQFRRFLISMLSAAIVGATRMDLSEAHATETPAAASSGGVDCGNGFAQFIEFNDAIGFNEFHSCNFNEAEPIAEEIDQIDPPSPDIPDIPDIPGGPGGPGDDTDPSPI